MPQVAVSFTFQLPYRLVRRKKWVTACCPVLDVCSQGSDEADALRNLTEALEAFITTCFEMGTLSQVLDECGFAPVEQGRRPGRLPRRTLPVTIPLQVRSEARCHA